MSRHEGVSCDACLKGNFRGRRFKCLICYDYDLCASCYESGATTTRHTTEHPMQCILTRVDYVEQPQSFTCPYCGKMGYTETSLQEHVTSEHAETSTEVGSRCQQPSIRSYTSLGQERGLCSTRPWVKISHSTTPRLHTSLSVVNRRYMMLSGGIQRIGSIV
ncbi:E3 ubiquitin-protein ligase KCMF1 [Liparis tanakae]|uniref:E3 ubiquitin-protein ligase KCMF1 n=1 Tax=Liparis tanakae TaxID=230148 RepID=A0A4Z2GJB9_9TELE|nr:E3 ubiquitin-protein ligase KCMF1 [Liparis tanakae]